MSAQHFSQIPKAEIQRSSFDRSHGHKTTINAGLLYPVFVDEALPGDTFNVKMHAIVRMATPIFPIMDNIYVDTQFFAVPYRLLWDNWEKFNGAQDKPTDGTDYLIPKIADPVFTAGSLGDYFGLPISATAMGQHVSALPFRAYNLIWNEWYRDQNLQDKAVVNTGDGPDALNQTSFQYRGKRHDYFTSCLPWPQKGDAVNVPLAGGTLPVTGVNGQYPSMMVASTGVLQGPIVRENASNPAGLRMAGTGAADAPLSWYGTALEVNLTEVSSVTINTLRQAFQIQKILERDARGGTRYTELIKAHFGVTSPDARLQRPEYLGGYSQPINISQIHQTSGTAGTGGYTDTPLGQVGAIGTAVLNGNNNSFTTSFTEHCVVIGLMSVRADMTYQQRIDRMWTRATRFDHYWPALAHIGEQAVMNHELYWANGAVDDEVFGYQERYGEYRYKPSMVTGKMRSSDPQSLDAWHLAYDFTGAPSLNAAFIQENPPIDRVIAVPSEPQFIVDMWFDFRAARPMPMYGVPGLIDHF